MGHSMDPFSTKEFSLRIELTSALDGAVIPGLEVSPLGCPFCGGEPQIANMIPDVFEAVCSDCGCAGPANPSAVEAAHRWNLRRVEPISPLLVRQAGYTQLTLWDSGPLRRAFLLALRIRTLPHPSAR
jgi:Lar family restriction alleviation protein